MPSTMQSKRAIELFEQHQHAIYVRTDKIFAKLFVLEYLAGIAAALIISPRTWIGAQSSVHIHVIAAVILGALIFSYPLYLIRKMPGSTLTRHTVAMSQMLFSALLIHLTGGRIETHFHVFGSLAFLVFYRDWRVLVSASLVVALDHFLRGMYWPASVYGSVFSGNWRWLEHTGWVLFEDVFLMLALSQSVKEMKSMAEARAESELTEAALEEARTRAEEANHAKSAFLANMSHEIRTPLGAMLGFTELMAEDPSLKEEQRKNLNTVLRNGVQLYRIINDILDLSKVEANKFDIEMVRFELGPMINDVASLLSFKAREKGLDFTIRSVGPLPETIVSDPTRFGQILTNIIGNAIKFTERGHVDVSFRFRDSDSSVLEVQVEDTGPGISRDSQEYLFRPFVQGDSATSRKFGGTGLGLYLSKRLAQTLGGDVRVLKSELGKGSCFLISISAGPLEAKSLMKPGRVDIHAVQDRSLERLDGVRVLVVDDSLDNLELTKFILGGVGAIVETVDRAHKALVILEKDKFDVVVMDIQMPEMDGYEAVRHLRQRAYRSPVLALTAHAMKGEKERCLNAGFDNYLVKPINRAELIRCVRSYANAKPSPGPSPEMRDQTL